MTNPSTGDLFGGANAVPIDLEPQEAAAGVDKAIALPVLTLLTLPVQKISFCAFI
jgi:hypothetical protein